MCWCFFSEKKPQPNKNIKANKIPGKKKLQRIVFSIALISFFLFPGNLVFFHFFPTIPTTGSPSKTFRESPSPSPGSPDVLRCGSNPSPGKQKPHQKEKREFTPEPLHCLLPCSARQSHPCRPAAPHRAPSTTDVLRS